MSSLAERPYWRWRVGHRPKNLPWRGVLWPLAAGLMGLLLVLLSLPQVLVVSLATVVMLVTLIQPLFGLGLALLLGPLGALEYFIWGSTFLDSGQAVLILALLAWLGRGMARRRLFLPQAFLAGPILVFVFVALVSLLRAPSLPLGLAEVIKWLEILLLIWLVVDLGSGRTKGGVPRIWWVTAMVLLAGVSQALVGIWQFALRGDGPEHFIVLERFYRAYGTFEQPNPFGGFMNVTLLLALGLLLGTILAWWQGKAQAALPPPPERRKRPMAARLLPLLGAGSATFLCGLGLIFSWSRGAWMGFAAGIAVMAFFLPRRRAVGFLLLLSAVLLFLGIWQAGVLPAAMSSRLAGFVADFTLGDVRGVDINDENYSVLERLAHWQAARQMARDQVWLGVGFGNYAAVYPQYALLNWPDALGHAHNYYLNLLAEVGVLGLLAYLALWGAALWQTGRVLRRRDWPARGLALGLMGVWFALAVHHLVDKLYVNNVYVHLGVLFGLLQLLDQPSRDGLGPAATSA